MSSQWKENKIRKASTWRQALLFNSLLLLMPLMAANIVERAYTSDIATDPMSLEARTETRKQIETSLRGLAGPQGQERDYWADRIQQTLEDRDFSAARGFLLAAPFMLNKNDRSAVLAAAEAETTGTKDQRLARAALLFLPDDVREVYETMTAPPIVIKTATDENVSTPKPAPEVTLADMVAAENGTAPEPTPIDEPESSGPVTVLPITPPENEPFTGKKEIDLLGDGADLVRRSQRWLAGERVDSMQIRMRGLGQLMRRVDAENSEEFARAASVILASARANRLNEGFQKYLTSRLEDAMPEETVRETLSTAFKPILTTDKRIDVVMQAYRDALEPEAHVRLMRDMVAISRLSDLTSSSGAMTLVEQVSSPEDMRRIVLITEAGGERSVALAREIGPEALDLAQIGAKWTMRLILQAMALMALGMALIWTMLSALTAAPLTRS